MTRLTTTPTHSDEAIEALRDGFAAHLSQTIPGRKELVVAEASGCTLKMADGRLYLDMISGIAVSNVGHSHPKVVAAVREQMGKYAHVNVYGRFAVPGQVEIAERLARVAPATSTSPSSPARGPRPTRGPSSWPASTPGGRGSSPSSGDSTVAPSGRCR